MRKLPPQSQLYLSPHQEKSLLTLPLILSAKSGPLQMLQPDFSVFFFQSVLFGRLFCWLRSLTLSHENMIKEPPSRGTLSITREDVEEGLATGGLNVIDGMGAWARGLGVVW